MASKQRVVVFDCGNKHTGIVVADVVFQTSFELVYMNMYFSEDMKNTLIQYCKDNVDKYIEEASSTMVIYENVFSSRGYPNWSLINIQKKVRKHYEDMNIMVRSLLPSQKWKIGGTLKNRKEKAVEYAEELLSDLDTDIDWLEQFRNIAERRHDMADALLTARYIMDNDVRKKSTRSHGTKRKKNEDLHKQTSKKKKVEQNVIDLVDDDST